MAEKVREKQLQWLICLTKSWNYTLLCGNNSKVIKDLKAQKEKCGNLFKQTTIKGIMKATTDHKWNKNTPSIFLKHYHTIIEELNYSR